VVALARAFQAGEECGFALYDALLEAGYPGPAGHFAGDRACRPGQMCLVVEEILDPRVPDLDDPTQDWPEGRKSGPKSQRYDEEGQDLTEEFLQVCSELERKGVARAEIAYDGNGDSGVVEGVVLFDRHGQEISPTKLTPNRRQVGKEPSVTDRLDDLAERILPGGWEINEGSYGTIILNVMTRRVHVGHTWRVESIEEAPFGFEL
jgi:hypothetical protein